MTWFAPTRARILPWLCDTAFAQICGTFRSTRFAVMRTDASIDDPNKPAFAANYFTGVPAPAGAITVLLPIYLAFLGVPMPPSTSKAWSRCVAPVAKETS